MKTNKQYAEMVASYEQMLASNKKYIESFVKQLELKDKQYAAFSDQHYKELASLSIPRLKPPPFRR